MDLNSFRVVYNTYDSKYYVFYTRSTQPPIPGTLDFTGFSKSSKVQKLYVFSPSVLPKIRGTFSGSDDEIDTERYRSGHNGADSKSVWEQSHAGSNPALSARVQWKVSSDGHFPLLSYSGFPVAIFLQYRSRDFDPKSGKHCVCRGNLGTVLQMSIDVCRRREVTMAEPFLNLLHGNSAGEHQ